MIFGGVMALLVIVLGFGAYVLLTGNAATGGSPAAMATGAMVNSTVTSPINTSDWEIAGDGPVSNIFLGDDNTLYAFMGKSGNTVYAMGQDGKLKWKYTVADTWRVLNVFASTDMSQGYNPYSGNHADPAWLNLGFAGMIYKPVFATDNGVLYLYVRENKTTNWNHGINDDYPLQPFASDWNLEERLLAISADGTLLWNVPISQDHHVYEDDAVIAKNGRIYVFDDYNVTVMNEHGSEIFRIPNASSPPAIDENGYLYIVPAVEAEPQPRDVLFYKDQGYEVPSSALESYYPNGTLFWRYDLDVPILRESYTSLYQNGTIWLPVVNGLWAFNTDGSVRWAKHYEGTAELFQIMPIDSLDNAYVYQDTLIPDRSSYRIFVHIITRDGNDTVRPYDLDSPITADLATGFMYSTQVYTVDVESESGLTIIPLGVLPSVNLTAYDVRGDKALWHYSITPNVTETVITSDNAGNLLNDNIRYKNVIVGGSDVYPDWSNDNTGVNPVKILPANDILYVIYGAANYEWPVVINQSKCAYASEIYALDNKNGKLLWEKPLDSRIHSVAANNSTIYYGTQDGKVFARQIGSIAGGLAVAAALYLFVKFFLVGAVSRARSRLDENDNRNSVMNFVKNNPGSTVLEISRGAGVNPGTVRYHLFILGLNHRVISNRADNKYVRYFTNTNSYSKDELFVMSLLKRDSLRKVLRLLMEKPGLSNVQLSRELNMPESSVSRYIKELSSRGVVQRNAAAGNVGSYFISDQYDGCVASAMERMGDN